MRKFRLDIEELTVESFATDSAASGMGTVQAHALIDANGDMVAITAPPPPASVDCSANPYTQCQSCYLSCIDTCNQPTCDSCGVTRCKANCG